MEARTPDTLSRLQAITDAALAHLGAEDLLSELLRRVTELLGTDTAAILLLDPETDELVARAARGLEEEVERGVRIPLGKGFAGRVAAERRAIAIEDLDTAEVLNPLLRERGLRSLLGVPLLVEGEVIGVLHVGTLTPRRFEREESALLQLAADRAAVAIEHARLYEAERSARVRAEAAAASLSRLQAITDAALAHLTIDELLSELLGRVVELLDTDTAAILLLDRETDELVARAARGLEEEVERGVRIPLGKGFAGRVAAERRAIAVEDLDTIEVVNPLLRERGVRSLLGVPLLVEGDVIGVLHVGTLTPRRFEREESELLQLAADRAALAIEHARLYEAEHGIAETLQRSLLPDRLPEMPGLELAARYLAAPEATGVGGDWYDAFLLPDGRVGLAIGDVMGRGLPAATVMGQLRNALRAYAIAGHAPAEIAELLNRLLRATGPAASATLLYLVYDPDTGAIDYVNAGHLPPLMISTDGDARLLAVRRAVPLGTVRHPSYSASTFSVAAGDALVIYTDGLVERRDEDLDAGLERLARSVAGIAPTAEQLCARALERSLPERAPADDVAVVVMRPLAWTERLELRLPAEPEVIPSARRVLARWLREAGADDDETYDILVACSEAASNSVEHSYNPERAVFEIIATRHDGAVTCRVRDFGQWRPPRGEHRGRGLALMEMLMESVEVTPGEDGTTVTMRKRLARA